MTLDIGDCIKLPSPIPNVLFPQASIMAAARPRHQRIFQTGPGGTLFVVRGPELEPGTRQSFKRYSDRVPGWREYARLPRVGPKKLRASTEARRLAQLTQLTRRQTLSGYAAFKSIPSPGNPNSSQWWAGDPSKPWLTTYQYREPGATVRNDTIIFHIHTAPAVATSSVPAPAQQTFLQRVGITAARARADAPPAVSVWQQVRTRKQIAPALGEDDDGLDSRRSLVLNEQGALFRSGSDVLYLDKTFWNLYFQDDQVAVDILAAGVYPRELSHVQRLAVDIAVLRNRDEFAAVAKAIKFHLPNVTSFWG